MIDFTGGRDKMFQMHPYREYDAAQSLKYENRWPVVISWVLLHSLHTHLHEFLRFRFSAWEQTAHVLNYMYNVHHIQLTVQYLEKLH